MNPVVRLNNVTKRFGAETALDGVSLEVPPGVVFALLGENGAGKTTAIRILLGLLEADAGRAQVLGLNSRRQGLEIRRRVGYVAERPTLYDWMTVAEIGWFAAGFYPDGFYTRYRELAAGFSLPERKRLKTLSKGMRAKVVLALAMAHDPDLLVLDEPTSGLDALVRREFLESMVDRAATGKTVFLSSHQIVEVERVADVVAILRKGQLVLVEPLDKLKQEIRELTITLMGCGAVLFAAERENGTYDFQRALPVPSRQVFGVKVLFALVSTAALLGALLLLAALLAGWTRPTAGDFEMQWAVIGLAALEVLAWTILFSLILQGPLKAAILGVTAASFVTYYLLSQKPGGVTALGSRAAVVMIVGLVDYVLGRRWFRDSTLGNSSWALWMSRLAPHWPARGVPALPSRGSVLGRLAWQHWRDSGWILVILGVLTALAALPAAMLPPYHTEPASFYFSSAPAGQTQLVVYWSLWFLGTIASSLLGVYAFRVDQRGASFRFLADRGVPPRMVWLSRQLAWLSLVASGTLVLLLLLATIWGKASQVAATPWRTVTYSDLPPFHAGRVLLIVVLTCALGQFCSMLLRSGILAAVFAVALSLVAVAWACVMATFEMNWLWSVAPIPVALFLATWLRVPGWMAERSRLRNWLLPGLALAMPALGLLTAVALVRAYEVPDVDPGFSLEEYSQPADPEAVKTAQMYLRALDLYVSWNAVHTDEPVGDSTSRIRKPEDQRRRTAAMLQANRESLAITLAATRRPSCDFLAQSELFASPEGPVSPETPRRPHPGYLAALVAMSARSLQKSGNLDEAREQWFAELRLSSHLRQRGAPLFGADAAMESEALGGLTDWAAQPGQSSQEVLDALRGLERILAGLPSPREPIKWASWHARRRLLEQPAPRPNQPLVDAPDAAADRLQVPPANANRGAYAVRLEHRLDDRVGKRERRQPRPAQARPVSDRRIRETPIPQLPGRPAGPRLGVSAARNARAGSSSRSEVGVRRVGPARGSERRPTIHSSTILIRASSLRWVARTLFRQETSHSLKFRRKRCPGGEATRGVLPMLQHSSARA